MKNTFLIILIATLLNSAIAQGEWVIGNPDLQHHILAKDQKFLDSLPYEEYIPDNFNSVYESDRFQILLNGRYARELESQFRFEYLQTSFSDDSSEINHVYILVFDRYAFLPENFDQSLDYGTFITELANIEEA